ncbi:MAG: hypothetical protein HY547_05240 [Elusimicrobia bacterium]|nr:hypothetical protein [Elusimicrobiota bacterium]
MSAVTLLITAGIFLCSCVATREDVSSLEVQVARLENNIAALEKRQADLAVQLDGLKRPLENLNSNLNDTQNLLNNFNLRFEEIRSQLESLRREILARQGDAAKALAQQQQEMGDRLDALEETLSQKIAAVHATAKTPSKNSAPKERPSASTAPMAAGGTAADAPLKLFQDAYKDFLAKRWGLAEQEFNSYIKSNPNGSLVDKSLYYQALAHKETKNFASAHSALDQLTSKFPKSPVARAGILEKAKLYLAQGKPGEAEGMLEYLIVSYAGTKEADEARELLKEIPHNKK